MRFTIAALLFASTALAAPVPMNDNDSVGEHNNDLHTRMTPIWRAAGVEVPKAIVRNSNSRPATQQTSTGLTPAQKAQQNADATLAGQPRPHNRRDTALVRRMGGAASKAGEVWGAVPQVYKSAYGTQKGTVTDQVTDAVSRMGQSHPTGPTPAQKAQANADAAARGDPLPFPTR